MQPRWLEYDAARPRALRWQSTLTLGYSENVCRDDDTSPRSYAFTWVYILPGLRIVLDTCVEYIQQLMRKSKLSKSAEQKRYTSAHTVLTLQREVKTIWSVTSVHTLERNHTRAGNVGGALLSLRVAKHICAKFIQENFDWKCDLILTQALLVGLIWLNLSHLYHSVSVHYNNLLSSIHGQVHQYNILYT